MFRHIIVAFDGSERACWQPDQPHPAGDDVPEEAYDGTPEARTALAAGYSIAAGDDVNPRTLLLHGRPAAMISAACEGVVDLVLPRKAAAMPEPSLEATALEA